MSLKTLFKSAVEELNSNGISFAVAGGFAADLYRHEPRLTMDIDLAVQVTGQAAKTATGIVEAIGLQAGVIRSADLAGGPMFAIKNKSTRPCIIVGRNPDQSKLEGVDLLLPEMPWVEQAVDRAQDNLIDFGFGAVPTLTLEDVIISKLYALQFHEQNGEVCPAGWQKGEEGMTATAEICQHQTGIHL